MILRKTQGMSGCPFFWAAFSIIAQKPEDGRGDQRIADKFLHAEKRPVLRFCRRFPFPALYKNGLECYNEPASRTDTGGIREVRQDFFGLRKQGFCKMRGRTGFSVLKGGRLKRAACLLCVNLLLMSLLPAYAAEVPYDPYQPQNLDPDHLTCTSAILIEADTGEVIFEKNADATIYPASTTKIMTTYLGLLLNDPDRIVTVSPAAVDVPSDSSVIPISIGEQVRLEDLMYATMLMSGNDGANAIAEAVGGNIFNFVNLMNNAAQSFGCTGTHFANPHGYHDENHYSTARDMCTIARIAMQNEGFRDIVSQATYVMPEDNIFSQRTLTTNNQFLNNTNIDTYYADGIGIKTGNTRAAGYCYIGAARRSGVTLISCVFHSSSDSARYTDTIKLMDYGFTQFKGVSIRDLYRDNPKVVDIAQYALDDSGLGKLTLALNLLSSEGSDTIVVSAQNRDYLTHHLSDITITEYTRGFTAPVTTGEVMGTMTYYNSQGEATVYELVATRSIERRERIAPTLDEIAAYSENDPNPFPRFTFEFALLYIALPLLAVHILFRLIRGLFRRKPRKKKKLGSMEPQNRFYR